MDPDPIAELVADVERDGKPSLAWLVRWSRRVCGVCRGAGVLEWSVRRRRYEMICYACDGARSVAREPLAAAWAESENAPAMVLALALAGCWHDVPRAAEGPGGAWPAALGRAVRTASYAEALVIIRGGFAHTVSEGSRHDDVLARPLARVSADIVREQVPTPPTLAALLTTVTAGPYAVQATTTTPTP